MEFPFSSPELVKAQLVTGHTRGYKKGSADLWSHQRLCDFRVTCKVFSIAAGTQQKATCWPFDNTVPATGQPSHPFLRGSWPLATETCLRLTFLLPCDRGHLCLPLRWGTLSQPQTTSSSSWKAEQGRGRELGEAVLTQMRGQGPWL